MWPQLDHLHPAYQLILNIVWKRILWYVNQTMYYYFPSDSTTLLLFWHVLNLLMVLQIYVVILHFYFSLQHWFYLVVKCCFSAIYFVLLLLSISSYCSPNISNFYYFVNEKPRCVRILFIWHSLYGVRYGLRRVQIYKNISVSLYREI